MLANSNHDGTSENSLVIVCKPRNEEANCSAVKFSEELSSNFVAKNESKKSTLSSGIMYCNPSRHRLIRYGLYSPQDALEIGS